LRASNVLEDWPLTSLVILTSKLSVLELQYHSFTVLSHDSLWLPCVAGADIIFLSGFFILSSSFSSPNLSGRKVDVYHTSTHGVALV